MIEMKRIYLVLIALIAMIYIIIEVRKEKFSIKESFWWIVASFLMLFLAIFPYSIDFIANLFGVAYPPSLFFVFCIIFLVFMNFKNNKKISEQQLKIIELAQKIAIIEYGKKDENKERK